MLKTVVLAEDPFDPRTWEEHSVEDIRAFLKARYPEWPKSARIYHDQVANSNDVTPRDAAGVDHLATLEGRFYIVIYPEEGATIAVVAVVLIAIGTMVYNWLTKKYPKSDVNDKGTTTSVNNSLAERENTARPKERIPDIFGCIRSTPDLIAVPYRLFKANTEFEYSYMCIGRGSYDVSDIREDKTLLTELTESTSVRFFGPNTSPNSGSPFLEIGEPITEPVRAVYHHSSVDGQVLKPPNVKFPAVVGFTSFSIRHQSRTTSTATITLNGTPGESLRDFYKVGDLVKLVMPTNHLPYWDPNHVVYFYDLNGSYEVLDVTDTVLTIRVDPADIRWNNCFHYDAQPPGSWYTLYEDHTITIPENFLYLTTNGNAWVGPYILDTPTADQIVSNYVAQGGLYKENGTTRTLVSVTIRLEYTPVDENGATIGAVQTDDVVLNGSSSRIITQRGISQKITLNPTGRYSVRVARITETDLNWDGTVQDEVVWRDLYGFSTVSSAHFGDVTTVQVETRSTLSARSVKRKFNLLATRKLPQWNGATQMFSETLYASQRADDIIPFLCLDQYIGRRTLAEVDVTAIRATIDEVLTYFGHERAIQFNYSFDSLDVTFEESLEMVASAVFCTAYRRGRSIKLSFESLNPNSTLLFNHRNKHPKTETRTVRFGTPDSYDGVELTFVDSDVDDEAKATFYLPEDGSAVNPKKIETSGITNKLQAYFHAHRYLNRLNYQNTTLEFDATAEAYLLLIHDRILVADGTRPNVQEGEIIAQNGLELTLSTEVTFGAGSYTLFVQHTDATVEAIACTAGSAANKVVLGQAPSSPLYLDQDAFAKATFILAGPSDTRKALPFLVTEVEPKSVSAVTVRGVNYSAGYYQNDTDYIDAVVSESGNLDPDYGDSITILRTAYGTIETAATTVDAILATMAAWPISTEV